MLSLMSRILFQVEAKSVDSRVYCVHAPSRDRAALHFARILFVMLPHTSTVLRKLTNPISGKNISRSYFRVQTNTRERGRRLTPSSGDTSNRVGV